MQSKLDRGTKRQSLLDAVLAGLFVGEGGEEPAVGEGGEEPAVGEGGGGEVAVSAGLAVPSSEGGGGVVSSSGAGGGGVGGVVSSSDGAGGVVSSSDGAGGVVSSASGVGGVVGPSGAGGVVLPRAGSVPSPEGESSVDVSSARGLLRPRSLPRSLLSWLRLRRARPAAVGEIIRSQ